MKLDRIPYEPGSLVEFYEEALTALGALCSRTWHDRLEVLGEGTSAKLWNPDGALHAVELQFVPTDAQGTRDAAREVFPGSPLTFRLAEALRPNPLVVERVVLAAEGSAAHAPDPGVMEKLWRNQFPDTTRWRQTKPVTADFHFSLVAIARCEIQAIDQQWSLRRVALALPSGEIDDGLARSIGFARPDTSGRVPDTWPSPDPVAWCALLGRAMEQELASELDEVRKRQETRLRRELDRVDDYFDSYERELAGRARRGGSARVKLDDRLAAAKVEHSRHRADQVARHEIAIVPHVDALLLVAEPAWQAEVEWGRLHQAPTALRARFVPRARRWELAVS